MNSVPIEKVHMDPALQVRVRGVQRQRVEALVQAVQGGASLPPVLVTPDPRRADRFVVVDGAHRLAAYRRLGARTVDVQVQEGAGWLDAFRANCHHGLPLSLEDRKAAAVRLRREHPEMSEREIARVVGLAPSTVHAVLKTPRRHERGVAPRIKATNPVRSFLRLLTRLYTEHGQEESVVGRVAAELAELVEAEPNPGLVWDALVFFQDVIQEGLRLTEHLYQNENAAGR
ncbi:MAG: ParB N-terminal domain-containing protein [Armatimonadota bacterium]|nr:ParB N-terminal domain-containing protein [Armatimonadota bacterium]